MESLGPLPTSPVSFERKDNLIKFNKRREEDEQSPSIGASFNPSKTFGGDRARVMFPLKNDPEDGTSGKEWGFASSANRNKDDLFSKSPNNNGNTTQNAQQFLPGLERLTKMFAENHSKMERNFDNVNVGNQGPFTSEFTLNRPTY